MASIEVSTRRRALSTGLNQDTGVLVSLCDGTVLSTQPNKAHSQHRVKSPTSWPKSFRVYDLYLGLDPTSIAGPQLPVKFTYKLELYIIVVLQTALDCQSDCMYEFAERT